MFLFFLFANTSYLLLRESTTIYEDDKGGQLYFKYEKNTIISKVYKIEKKDDILIIYTDLVDKPIIIINSNSNFYINIKNSK